MKLTCIYVHYVIWQNKWFTCADETITGESRIAGAVEAVRYVGTGGMFAASSVVLGAFIRICRLYHSPTTLD